MIFNNKSNIGEIYAVHSGEYAGEMLILIDVTTDFYKLLAVPTMVNRNIPVKSFDMARNNDIIKYVEHGPVEVVQICVKQYYENEKSNNRLNSVKSS